MPKLPDRLSPARVSRGPDVGPERPPGMLSEVFATAAMDGAPTGFVLASLSGVTAPVLWVQDRLSRREAGVPCLAGLPEGLEVMHLKVSKPLDVLWALEQALGAAGLGGVIGEVWGDPPALDFTATKRLALRAEARALPCWLIRRAASANLSAARERWRVGSLPSLPDPEDQRAPGQPLWSAELFRSRWRAPAAWVARHEPGRGLVLEHGTEAEGGAVADLQTAAG
ncbi:hypothetical protein [Wenxinia marina]|uniref:hypothetical protein n=1 Tax=Wenxinia marina TaxID=390641 RepID=UPI0012E008FA|nr:hypothetical protein [Wenxinia marina]GGL65145.1 hypothetical protein GCM10011392_19750 [Wenxinia marina]